MWTRQPPAGTPLDRSNPLTAGLVHAFPMNGTPYDAASGLYEPTLNEQKFVARDGQIVSQHDGVGDSINVTDNDRLFVDQMSIFAVGSMNTVGGANDRAHLVGRGDAWFMSQGLESHDMRCIINADSSTGVQIAPPGTLNTGQLYAFGMSYNGAKMRGFIDGEFNVEASNTGPISDPGASTTRIGIYDPQPTSSFFSWDGDIAIVLVWNRALTDAEQKTLAQNPWQIFRPRPRFAIADVPTDVRHASIEKPNLILPKAAPVFVDEGDERYDVGKPMILEDLEVCTIWSWLYLDGAGFRAGRIFSNGDNLLELWINGQVGLTESQLEFNSGRVTTPALATASAADNLPLNQWVFVAATWKFDELPKLWIGDLLTAVAEPASYDVQSAGSGANANTTSLNNYIGARPQFNDRGFGGRIAGCGIVGRDLSQSELDSIRRRPHNVPNTLGLWVPCHDGYMNRATDFSGHENHGIMGGANLTLGEPIPLAFDVDPKTIYLALPEALPEVAVIERP